MPALPLILVAVFALALAGAAPAPLVRERPRHWPKGWPAPPQDFLPAVGEAHTKYGVPVEYLVTFGYLETRFEPWWLGKVRPASWNKIKDKLIGDGPSRWRDHYTADDMRAVGIMGVMPFNFIGVKGGLPAGAPIRAGLPIRFNVLMAARLLRTLYDRTGDWVSALHGYNPGGGDAYYQALRTAIDAYLRATKGIG